MSAHAPIAAIETLLEKVRRRWLLQLIIEQSSYAAIFGMAAVILLLVFGTQILNWYWPVIIFGVMLGVGCYRFLRSSPTMYQIAQTIDRRLGLHDSISTAYFFRQGQSPVEAAQRRTAESLAPTIDPAQAAPFVVPPTAYAAAIVTTIAFAMLAFRYGVLHNLDLRQPMVAGLNEIFHASPSKQSAAVKKMNQRGTDPLEGEAVSLDENTIGQEMIKEKANEGEITAADIPDVNDLTLGRNVDGKGETEGNQPNEATQEAGSKAEKGNADQDADPSSQDGAQGMQQQGKNSTPPPNGAKEGNNKNSDPKGENASLLDKMRDALNNMMSKLNVPNKAGEKQQTAQSKQGKQAGGGQKQDKNGQQQQQGQKEEGQQSQEQQGDQEGEGQQAQSAQGKNGDKSGDQKASPDAKSGVGKSDGDKDVKYAEQLSAMGKISEILGKRAQNIQGEVMMEVQSGKQQLRTQYSSQAGGHQESSGEIHRDEVPLQHQHYVQQYFEEVRKTQK